MPASTLQLQRINTATTDDAAAAAVNNFCKHHHRSPQTSSSLLLVKLPSSISMPHDLALHHTHLISPNQCCSSVVQTVNAPIDTVWALVRRFDNPQAYKHFLKSCNVILGHGDVGSLREVHVISGLPAGSSTERLEILDDDRHVTSFSVVGGDHRLVNYRSVTTLHGSEDGEGTTVVVESYVVDVPVGNTREDTCAFVDTIVRCNLHSLAQLSEKLAK